MKFGLKQNFNGRAELGGKKFGLNDKIKENVFKKENVFFLFGSLAIILFLCFLPTGFEGAVQFKDAEKCSALVLSVDNSSIIDTGIIRTGQQICLVRFLNGRFKGKSFEGWNMLGGSLSQDKLFRPGDKVQCVVHYDLQNDFEGNFANDFENPENYIAGEIDDDVIVDYKSGIISVNLIDYYRLHGEFALAVAFALFLIFFARGIGLRSVLSFAVTVLVLWKIMVPLFLKGYNPIATGLAAISIMTFMILALVYGFDRRLISSFCGSMSGILFAMLLSVVCSKAFHIHGAVMSNSEALLYAGFQNLNLTQIFMASVCIGASGSVMDLSVDITSAVSEVVRNCPNISRINAMKSGLTVARAAMGTMTTTLLLAYSGTCIAMLMTFMAQGTPIYNILNNNIVAAEIISTIAGSFGLAMTAPLTACVAGWVIAKRQ